MKAIHKTINLNNFDELMKREPKYAQHWGSSTSRDFRHKTYDEALIDEHKVFQKALPTNNLFKGSMTVIEDQFHKLLEAEKRNLKKDKIRNSHKTKLELHEYDYAQYQGLKQAVDPVSVKISNKGINAIDHVYPEASIQQTILNLKLHKEHTPQYAETKKAPMPEGGIFDWLPHF